MVRAREVGLANEASHLSINSFTSERPFGWLPGGHDAPPALNRCSVQPAVCEGPHTSTLQP